MKGNKAPLALPLLAGICIVLSPLRGETLATYTDFLDQNEELVTAPTTTADGLLGSEIALSDEGTLGTGDAQASEWSSPLPYIEGFSGWDEGDSATAKAFTFTIEAEAGHTFDLTELRFEDRATGAGPSAMSVSIDDGEVFSRNVADSETVLNEIPLAGLGLNNLTTAEFVFAGWDNGSRATTGGGQWRTAGYEIEGTISSIPEPSTWALLSGCLALAATGIARHRGTTARPA